MGEGPQTGRSEPKEWGIGEEFNAGFIFVALRV
jgi:hypothetical protein